jgi:conserved domain protein
MSLEDKLQQATGAAKELAGKVTGDKSTETEGAVEKGLGKAKEVIDNVKESVEGAQLKELKTTSINNTKF